MEFYKNIKLEKVPSERCVDEWELTIKINEMFSQKIKLSADQLEHIINSYRFIK